MTNWEKIQSMSEKEFAGLVFRNTDINCNFCSGNKLFCIFDGCCDPKHIEEWLKQESN